MNKNNRARRLYQKTYRAHLLLLALRDTVQHDMEFANNQGTYYNLRHCLKCLSTALYIAGRAAVVVPSDSLEGLKGGSYGEVVRWMQSRTPRMRIERCRVLVLALLSEVAQEAGTMTAMDSDFVPLVTIKEHMGAVPRILEDACGKLVYIR